MSGHPRHAKVQPYLSVFMGWNVASLTICTLLLFALSNVLVNIVPLSARMKGVERLSKIPRKAYLGPVPTTKNIYVFKADLSVQRSAVIPIKVDFIESCVKLVWIENV